MHTRFSFVHRSATPCFYSVSTYLWPSLYIGKTHNFFNFIRLEATDWPYPLAILVWLVAFCYFLFLKVNFVSMVPLWEFCSFFKRWCTMTNLHKPRECVRLIDMHHLVAPVSCHINSVDCLIELTVLCLSYMLTHLVYLYTQKGRFVGKETLARQCEQ